ncbi:hypothetical protein NYP18_02190 [Corynebacterium sp. YIM 101645]|uniref:DUF2273 domain-containing protein n=1 Tax=Corynebacterium lemuris TaxID=1859292 RepID=A0ABT2FTA3_9CORY|nr:hypothetical protein [Corynebacterium lemuris]MCS5478456.1 hypothetical protein [Corynebacterium lemuris]
MSSHTRTGTLIGLALAFALILGGWAGLLYAVALGGAGAVIGAHLDRRINLRTFLRSLGGRG